MTAEWCVGLMTGTVLDGHIDVALLRTDGERIAGFGPFALYPYDTGTTRLLFRCLAAARDWNFEGPEPAVFAAAEDRLTRTQADAVVRLVGEAGLSMAADIAAVGFHGQTVLHRPPAAGRIGRTRQLGDGPLMARRLGVDVVHDFRRADMAAGGQGAPLAAVYHGVLLDRLGDRQAAILNLGGVANLTARDGRGRLVAFDTGPANAPINDFVRARGLGEMDRDGQLAATGRVDRTRLAKALAHPWFARPGPKSLDRFDFGHAWVDGLPDADGAATLTALTAAAVGRGLDLLPARPARLIVCGGGRRNPTLLSMLATLAKVAVEPAERVGWDGDAIEAQCFACLAMRRLRGLPASFPETTGTPAPTLAGNIASAGQGARRKIPRSF